MKPWHSIPVEKILKELQTSPKGLSSEEAQKRLEKYGKNEIEKKAKINPLKIFISQFTDFLILILIAAAIISYLMSFLPGKEEHLFDSILIITILTANAIIGFIQEYRAEKSIEALKKLSAPKARVIRDGIEQEIDSEKIVPGDILVLEQGDKITADARIISEVNLETDESALTGESLPVGKTETTLKEKTSLAERKNMLFMQTIVTRGRAKAVVIGTGMDTEVGKIAKQIAETEQKPTPFQVELDKLGKKIGAGILVIIAFVAIIQIILIGGSIVNIFLTAISLAVAAVPEGLPAIVTLALTIGVRKMSKKNALARKLPVAESLGSVDTICTDKTGTLTENKMTVRKIFIPGKELKAENEGLSLQNSQKGLVELLKCSVICNNAAIGRDKHGKKKYLGDPTEIALLALAEKTGMDIKIEKGKAHRLMEIPFSSDRKMMTVVCSKGNKKIAYSKGAPEIIIEKCTHILLNGKKAKLGEKEKKEILEKNSEFGKQALRVLAFAFKEVKGKETEKQLEKELTFLGLEGMIDPPRKGVKEAISDCRKAGIKVIMLTGDNINTAKAIGTELGFNPKKALTGLQVDELSEKELKNALNETEIFARVSPSHKSRILNALQEKGKIVAMTGDGVNDAPALKRADVGVAMGIRGTDVAKETSDLVLLDDNFITIRDAVAEGRGIFDNIQKFVNYLLSSNLAEVLVVFIFTLLALQIEFGKGAIILTAAQLLWINLLTDGLPAVALGLDPKAEKIMERPPRKKNEGVINKRMIFSITAIGVAMTVVIMGLFLNEFFTSAHELPEKFIRAQTMAFTCFVVFEMVRVQTVRANFKTKILSNKWLWLSVIFSFLLQLMVLYSPLNKFFKVVPLSLIEWVDIAIGVTIFLILSFIIVKIEKRLFWRD